MSAQTNYRYTGPIGVAGGLADLAPHAIDSFVNEEDTGKMKFGIGVVQGENPGKGIKIPDDSAKAEVFEGISTNNRTTEYDLEGAIYIRKGAAVGVMRYGRIFARVAEGAAPAYGDQVYIVTSGDEAGFVTNESDGAMEIKGRFMSKVDPTTQVAEVELFNQAQA